MEFNSGCIVQQNMLIQLINRGHLNECHLLNVLAKECQCNNECTLEKGCFLLQKAKEQFREEVYESCEKAFIDFGLNA